MGDGDDAKPAEVRPFNPAARWETGGIWNDRKLPVTEWEIAEQRVVLPVDLHLVLDIPVPVLRWDRENYLMVGNMPATSTSSRASQRI